MPAQPEILKRDWRPIVLPGMDKAKQERIHSRIDKILESWYGTPYMAFQSCKGRQGGVDCIRFVCAVADELYGYSRGPVISLPADQSMHDRVGSITAMRKIKERYDPVIDCTDLAFIEPGDILVTGPVGGGPGHAMFVGIALGNIWETTIDGVRKCGMPAFGTESQLFRIYRVQDKDRWDI